MNITQIPLSQLHISTHNARKTGGKNVADLAASIIAHGLLQNITVTESGPNKYAVVAGGRRLRALQQLDESGQLPVSLHNVPCNVIANGEVIEASTAENTIREAMHPADQCEAFMAMLEKKSEADVAAHFGVTVLYVRQRLKLAKVSPKILQAFREDKIGLEEVEAYALSNDHAAQERTYKQGGDGAGEYWIRSQLTKGEVAATDPRVKLIGLGEYETAGGAVRRDLFDDDNAGYIADIKLLDRLADIKIEEVAAKVRGEGWSFVVAGVGIETYRYERVTKPDKTKTGAIVTLAHNGDLDVVRGVLRPGQKAPKPAAKKAAGNKSSAPEPKGLSQAVQASLAGYRTAVVRLELTRQPRVMLAALAADLASRYLDKALKAASVVLLQRDHRFNGYAEMCQSIDEAPATKTYQQLAKEWSEKLRKEVGKGDLLVWLLQQPETVTHQLLAFVTAGMLNLSLGEGDSFAGGVGIEFKSRWQADATWLAKLQKGTILAIVREVHGKTYDAQLQPLSRDDVAKRAAQLLAGTGWLPEPLRGPGYEPKKAAPAITPAPVAKAVKKTTAKPAKKPAPKKAVKKAAAKKPAKKAKKK
jgi:ParB family chromosome partitioning protein